MLASPVYSEPPRLLDNGLYRVRGGFPFRPVGISFDLLFKQAEGDWQLYGVSIAPVEMPADADDREDAAENSPKPGAWKNSLSPAFRANTTSAWLIAFERGSGRGACVAAVIAVLPVEVLPVAERTSENSGWKVLGPAPVIP